MRDTIERGWHERTVTVKTTDLITTLKENCGKHNADYVQAMKDYKDLAKNKLGKLREKALSAVSDNFDRINKSIDEHDPENEIQDVITLVHSMSFSLDVPRDHTHSYDVALKMAEWEVNETIELTQSQFQCFVLDEWDWTKDFSKMSKTYSAMNQPT